MAQNTESVKIGETKSVCPVCLKAADAQKIYRDGSIYLEKQCSEHGFFSVLIWEDSPESYFAWDRGSAAPDKAADAKKASSGCPYDCGLCEEHLRSACCVLLEVTQRCSLECPVCFASSKADKSEDPSLSQIRQTYKNLMKAAGPCNIQLSGGEPALRDDLDQIIRIGKEEGFSFFQLNTNGLRIASDKQYLNALREAGLNCVYLQFDALDDEAYRILRGRDLLLVKKQAIDNCIEADIAVVLVPVIAEGINDDQAGRIIMYAAQNLPHIRGVHFQPASRFGRYDIEDSGYRLTIPSLLNRIEEQTGGKIKREDFIGGGAENSYCSFHASFVVAADMEFRASPSVSQDCCSASSEQSRDALARQWTYEKDESCCSGEDTDSCCCDAEDKDECCGQAETAAEPEQCCCEDSKTDDSSSCCCTEEDSSRGSAAPLYSADSLDQFLNDRKNRTLTVSGMFFQDAFNFDLDRVKNCYICETAQDGSLIPFCAYNLTDSGGKYLYRGKK